MNKYIVKCNADTSYEWQLKEISTGIVHSTYQSQFDMEKAFYQLEPDNTYFISSRG